MTEYENNVGKFEIIFTVLMVLSIILFLGYQEYKYIQNHSNTSPKIEITK